MDPKAAIRGFHSGRKNARAWDHQSGTSVGPPVGHERATTGPHERGTTGPQGVRARVHTRGTTGPQGVRARVRTSALVAVARFMPRSRQATRTEA